MGCQYKKSITFFILNFDDKAHKIILRIAERTEHNANPVRNSSGALDLTRIVLKKSNPAAEQGGIISNGAKKDCR